MTAVPSVTTREGLREALGDARPGLVPTMGALHAGHLSLISRSASENPLTVVSVFVNPTQFTNPEDLAHYPRDLETDVALARQAGADLIFAPTVEAIYPPGFDTTVEVGHLSDRWEGASRPGHLRAVATVVTILLNLAQPTRAYFGEKDFQQLQVVRQIHRDLALPGEIVGCPTVRDEDGLALSSRNVQLSRDERAVPWRCPAPSQRLLLGGSRRNRRSPARSGRSRPTRRRRGHGGLSRACRRQLARALQSLPWRAASDRRSSRRNQTD